MYNTFLRMRFLLSLGLIISTFISSAQILDPVSWKFSSKRISNEIVEIQAQASIDKGWHLYSTVPPEEDAGPIPTEFSGDSSGVYFTFASGVKESPKPDSEFDPNFGVTVSHFSKKADFSFRIKVHSADDFNFEGAVFYMVCDDEQCLPPKEVEFSLPIKGNPDVATKEVETMPIDYTEIDTPEVEEVLETPVEQDEVVQEPVISKDGEDKEENSTNFLSLFIFSFLGGFAALLTPCVFPMLPLTVSFFTNRSKTRAAGIRNAFTYGLSIIVLYVALGYGITAIFGPAALNRIAVDPYVNFAFFVLLVIFAISFFGAFEITLPQSWANKADQAAERGGLVGIFFMALVLAVVSFSCTGPIIGTLLFEAFSGGVAGPVIGMFGFSLALALPFGLFAAFPGWMNSLPKSGGWLNSVKVVLGFLELALALKFLSMSDLFWQWGLLKRETFILLWITIGVMLTLYLMGAYRLAHDSKVEKLTVTRLFFVMISLGFTIYLVPGLTGAPLGAVSGITPPIWYSNLPKTTPIAAYAADGEDQGIPDGADPEHCPLNLNCFHDFEKGLAYAKKVNKPIFIDFTGYGCVNCRKMEENVWSDPRIERILRNDVVLISLYVDDPKKLPKDEWYYSEHLGQKVKTIGNRWAEFQVMHYNRNSQPFYLFLDHESMVPLTEPEAYNSNATEYYEWLLKGVEAFKAKNAL
jgi:thiol:disulfide interchange protein